MKATKNLLIAIVSVLLFSLSLKCHKDNDSGHNDDIMISSGHTSMQIAKSKIKADDTFYDFIDFPVNSGIKSIEVVECNSAFVKGIVHLRDISKIFILQEKDAQTIFGVKIYCEDLHDPRQICGNPFITYGLLSISW